MGYDIRGELTLISDDSCEHYLDWCLDLNLVEDPTGRWARELPISQKKGLTSLEILAHSSHLSDIERDYPEGLALADSKCIYRATYDEGKMMEAVEVFLRLACASGMGVNANFWQVWDNDPEGNKDIDRWTFTSEFGSRHIVEEQTTTETSKQEKTVRQEFTYGRI